MASYGASASYFFTVPASGREVRYDCTYALGDSCTFRGVREGVRRDRDAGRRRLRRRPPRELLLGGRAGILAAERATLEPGRGSSRRRRVSTSCTGRSRRRRTCRPPAGFVADSTLGFNRAAGYRASTTLPFRPVRRQRRTRTDLLEVPLVVEDSALLGPIAARGARLRARSRAFARGHDAGRRRCDDVPVPSRQARLPRVAGALRVVAGVRGRERRLADLALRSSSGGGPRASGGCSTA